MRGIVKWFSKEKGWGFLTSDEGTDYFVHFSGIEGKGFRFFDSGDFVSFDIEECARGWQAVNVQPVLTRKMVVHTLKKENLQLKTLKDARGDCAYMVVDANDIVQTGNQGLSLIEVAAYAGIDTEGLE